MIYGSEEVEEIIAEEHSPFITMDYLRDGFQQFIYGLTSVLYFIQSYAWHMVFAGILLYYINIKFVFPLLKSVFENYQSYKKQKEEQEYDAKYHKDPDLFSQRISAQQAYAQKLQEKYDQEAKEHLAKQKERDEKKRQEVLNLLDQGGHKLGTDSGNNTKPFRPEYNPLMGPGSSSNYRPPKRSKCGGGGCG